MILLKGSSNAGIGCNPALGMTWLVAYHLTSMTRPAVFETSVFNHADENDSKFYDRSCLRLNDLTLAFHELSLMILICKFWEPQFDD